MRKTHERVGPEGDALALLTVAGALERTLFARAGRRVGVHRAACGLLVATRQPAKDAAVVGLTDDLRLRGAVIRLPLPSRGSLERFLRNRVRFEHFAWERKVVSSRKRNQQARGPPLRVARRAQRPTQKDGPPRSALIAFMASFSSGTNDQAIGCTLVPQGPPLEGSAPWSTERRRASNDGRSPSQAIFPRGISSRSPWTRRACRSVRGSP